LRRRNENVWRSRTDMRMVYHVGGVNGLYITVSSTKIDKRKGTNACVERPLSRPNQRNV